MTLVRAAAAALVLAALTGLGPPWLPSAGILLVIGLSPLVVDAGVRARERHGRWMGIGIFLGRRWFEVTLSLMALAGIAVGFVGLGLGLGHERVDVDEYRLASSVLGFFRSGALEHGTSEDHPGLHFWILTAGGIGAYLWALMTGLIRNIEEVQPELFVWAGRIVNVILAAGTTVLTGLVGRAVGGRAAGLLAAAIMLLSPLSLETSAQLRNDVGMVFFVMVCAYAAQIASANPRRFSPFALGAMAGCAAGTKITAVFALLPVALAVGIPARGLDRRTGLVMCVTGFLAAVAVTNHFIWSDFPTFIAQIAMDYGHVQKGHFAFADEPRLGYLRLLIDYAVGWPLLLCAAGFAVWGLATSNRKVWLLVAFPIAYLWFMTLKHALFPRWVYVLVPFIAVAGAVGMLEVCLAVPRLVSRLATGPRATALVRVAAYGLALAILWPVAWPGTVAISRRFSTPTYARAEAWLVQYARAGDLVLSESGELNLDHSALRAVRVDDLRTVLGSDDPELGDCKWVVVQKGQFGLPALAHLSLAKQFPANFGFGGSRGLDVRIYVPRPPAKVPTVSDVARAAASPCGT